jgi:hypothetical protein
MMETKKDVKEIKVVTPVGETPKGKIVGKIEEPAKPREDNYTKKLKVLQQYDQYVTNLTNARYFTARCNMIAKQLLGEEEMTERVDDKLKPKQFLEAEYFLTKFRAYRAQRDSYFNVLELNKLGIANKDIDAMYKDRMEGPIARETYEESFKVAGKAAFVPQDAKK